MSYRFELVGGPHDGALVESGIDPFTGELPTALVCPCGCRGTYQQMRGLSREGRLVYRWWPDAKAEPTPC